MNAILPIIVITLVVSGVAWYNRHNKAECQELDGLDVQRYLRKARACKVKLSRSDQLALCSFVAALARHNDLSEVRKGDRLLQFVQIINWHYPPTTPESRLHRSPQQFVGLCALFATELEAAHTGYHSSTDFARWIVNPAVFQALKASNTNTSAWLGLVPSLTRSK